ncbi:hypothetical protein M3Y94_00843900 [Aphelenchoides besseyi]|nr:hypothetical protein M3Y94_00843900 [Aphelenchoides besseyi]
MTTFLNSPLTRDFDHVGTFTPLNPLLARLGVDQFMMLRILRDNCSEFAYALKRNGVEAVDAVDICGGRGFLSHILRITVHFTNPTQSPFAFVLKIPTTTTVDAIVESLDNNDGSVESVAPVVPHDAECRFYAAFSNHSSALPLPRVYYASEKPIVGPNGAIFMEDLSNRGACVDVFDSLTEAQCTEVAESIAQLQVQYEQMEIERREAIASGQCVHTTVEKQRFLDEFLSRIGDYGNDFVELVDQLKVVANVDFAQFALIDQPKAMGCTSLSHNDLWVNNVLFRLDDPQRLCALIDWQTAFQGNPMFDLAFLLATSTNADVRRSSSERLVDRYYDALTEAHKEHETSPRFSRQQAHQLFQLSQIQVAPVLGALLCFFGRSMSLSGLETTILDTKMSILSDRTKAVLEDAVTLLSHVNIEDFENRK